MEPQALAACLLLCSVLTSGCSPQTRFIQTNRDLLMTVTEGAQIGEDPFHWRFKNSTSVVRWSGAVGDKPTINKDYVGRVEFFPQNLSLILKNVQLSDTGLYRAVVSRDKEEVVASCDVTVQDPVSAVSLSVDSVSVSSDSCNFTVSCKTESSILNISRSFTCDRHTCEEAHLSTPDPAPSLHLYLSDVSILCNHSNHVSWRNDTRDIRRVCPLFGDTDLQGSRKHFGLIVKGIVIFLAIAVILGVVTRRFIIWKRNRQSGQMENEPSPEPSDQPAPDTD